MSEEKQRRLRWLASLSPEMVPTLVDSEAELNASSHDGDWYVRASDAYIGDRVIPRARTYAAMSGAQEPISLQPMILAKYSGTAYVSGLTRLVEGVDGAADSLLRGGVRADTSWMVLAAEHLYSSVVVWEQHVQQLLEHEIDRFAKRHSKVSDEPCVLEWIVDHGGRLWFVDLKAVPQFELTLNREGHPAWLSSGEAEWADTGRVVRQTALAMTPRCADANEITFLSGSILSHLSVRLILSGVVVRVATPQLHPH